MTALELAEALERLRASYVERMKLATAKEARVAAITKELLDDHGIVGSELWGAKFPLKPPSYRHNVAHFRRDEAHKLVDEFMRELDDEVAK